MWTTAQEAIRPAVPRLLAAVTALMVAAVTMTMTAAPGRTEPTSSAEQLLVRYKKLARESEQSAEAMHNAQIEYDKQRKIARDARARSTQADRVRNDAVRELARYQQTVNVLARAGSKGARVNRLYAVLVSDSPQSLLDQMSGLEVLSRQTAANLRGLTKAKREASSTKDAADRKAADADKAMAKVSKTKGDLQSKQSTLQLQAIQVRTIYESMTGKQLAALRGPRFTFDPRLLPKGTAYTLAAVQSALTRIGDPYVWGATGPDQFDCSGLMVWAYRQVGKTLPRSSQAQMGGGTPVDRSQLEPGDLIIYYPDASHVGMYVGNGYVIHASTFGIPVKVVPVDDAGPYNTARRY
ncbi:C40 family peptidase [Gordonia pseudamarae]|jgi:cell wall-associated NlpC family hydrolase|nr:C40 family peptidase [Gordonia sp. (in: high G+C Gram-positive bacteria)]